MTDFAAVPLPPELARIAAETKGFLPDDEADALRAVVAAHVLPGGVTVEIGTYCGKSAIHLGHVVREAGATLVTIDHHRGSEEQQVGWEYHDPELVDPRVGAMDTLPFARQALFAAGLEEVVVPVVGRSRTISAFWATPLDAVFVDGGHTEEAAQTDYDGWAPHVREGGVLVIHDVFPDPADGGQAPFHVYERALAEGFTEILHVGSLRALRR
ncbi:class I SAM-dependent methyltransferase [Aeromicrobium sp. Leaf350]|uniref:class I SAM-dependent methyltransferase n=1 Tax=Aeromicrobium sp. Leaf350 TaxID=2876565 RepID=UPI001E560FDB|nr:class I SAM-dependent methyltransferase [Aeromicrobium sp. Leaf350]